jgi:hypothetical protein
MGREREGCLPNAEVRLLRQINQGFGDSWRQRYHDLIDKRQESVLNTAEYRELIAMSDEVERITKCQCSQLFVVQKNLRAFANLRPASRVYFYAWRE